MRLFEKKDDESENFYRLSFEKSSRQRQNPSANDERKERSFFDLTPVGEEKDKSPRLVKKRAALQSRGAKGSARGSLQSPALVESETKASADKAKRGLIENASKKTLRLIRTN